MEQDRLSRAQAAFGGETMARMKVGKLWRLENPCYEDINVLILGCRGVGVGGSPSHIRIWLRWKRPRTSS